MLLKNVKRNIAMVLCLAFVLSLSLTSFASIIDKVIVIVNDEVVTQREFDRTFLPIQRNFETNFTGEELEEKIEAAKKAFLEQLVNTKLAISLAKKKKIEINEDELNAKVETIRSYFETEDDFLKALQTKGTNQSEFEREIREQMLAQKLIEKEVASKIIITPADLQELYKKNKEKLNTPPKAKVRGILLSKTGDENEDIKTFDKARDVLKRARRGNDFAELAIEYSEGPYSKNGGDMGFIPPGQLLKELDQVIFSLKEGDVSDVVETHMGYHIFKVEGVETSRALKFDEVSEFLRQQLFMKQLQENLDRWIEGQRQRAYIYYK